MLAQRMIEGSDQGRLKRRHVWILSPARFLDLEVERAAMRRAGLATLRSEIGAGGDGSPDQLPEPNAPGLAFQAPESIEGTAPAVSAKEAIERAECGGGSRPLGLRSRPRLVAVAVLAVALIVLVGVVVGIVARLTPSAQPNRDLGHEAGSVPAARIGLVAMSFTDAQLGYGVYEPFNPGAAIPPPRLVRTSDGGADWFVVGPTPPAPPSDSVGQIHLVFVSAGCRVLLGGRVTLRNDRRRTSLACRAPR